MRLTLDNEGLGRDVVRASAKVLCEEPGAARQDGSAVRSVPPAKTSPMTSVPFRSSVLPLTTTALANVPWKASPTLVFSLSRCSMIHTGKFVPVGMFGYALLAIAANVPMKNSRAVAASCFR